MIALSPSPRLAENAQMSRRSLEHLTFARSGQAGARVLAVLNWDDGSCTALYGPALCGRNPRPEWGLASIAVRDETLTLSKTHFEIGGGAAGPWIADRHSTNGTVLVRGGGRHPLLAGLPTTLRAGDRLELGDRSAVVGLAS